MVMDEGLAGAGATAKVIGLGVGAVTSALIATVPCKTLWSVAPKRISSSRTLEPREKVRVSKVD